MVYRLIRITSWVRFMNTSFINNKGIIDAITSLVKATGQTRVVEVSFFVDLLIPGSFRQYPALSPAGSRSFGCLLV